MSTIHSGDPVRVHYTTKSLEGYVIESSSNRDPLEFTAGGDDVIRGLSDAVIGLQTGDRRSVTVTPESAFGRHSPDLMQSASRTALPDGTEAGDQLTATAGDIDLDVWVQRITGDEAILDANHPLAGETLVIDLEVV